MISTKNLNAHLEAKGYHIFKAPILDYVPVVGYFYIPTWVAYEYMYRSPKKGICYTEEGVRFKLKIQADRKKLKETMRANARKLNNLI
jgi:hypothetical protein